MAERVRSQYTNLVKLKLDQRSLKRTRRQIQNFRSEVAKLMKFKVDVSMPKVPAQVSQPRSQFGRQPKQQRMDAHVKRYQEQLKFNELQKDSIDNFMVSNRLVREASESRKKAIIQQLKQTKNAKELRLEIRKIRASLSDEFRKRKQILRESEKQLAVQRRFNSSITQMIGGLGSVYALTTAVGSSLRTGMAMEGMEKSFKVVSADSKAAAENMEWVRKEAMRLGAPIVEASKGFASMIAAAGNKMSMDDLKATFTGIQEAGVALGLSREDLGGTILAVKQMLSRLLGRVNFLNSGNILTF